MNLDEFIQQLKKLRLDCPTKIVSLPPHTNGLPTGSYNLEPLLKCIVMSLEGNEFAYRKGGQHDGSRRTY